MGDPVSPPLGLSPRGVSLVRAGIVAWTAIGIALLSYGAWQVVLRLRLVLIALGLAVLIVAVLEPLVSRLESRRIPRWGATAFVYVAFLLPAGIGTWWLVRLALSQLEQLVAAGPAIVDELEAVAGRAWMWMADAGVPLPAEDPATWVAEHQDTVAEWAVNLVTAATRFTGFLIVLIVAPVLAFYLLVALPRLRSGLLALLPPVRRDQVVEGLGIVGHTFTRFFQGQFLIAVIVGILSTAGLLILGVPYAVLIGAIAGITNLVPFFGPIVGSVPGVILGWAEGGIWLAVWVTVLFVVVQQFESYVLSPLIVGSTVRLRPFAVILGMVAGGFTAGLLGMILAVPLMGAVKALYVRFGPVGAAPPAD